MAHGRARCISKSDRKIEQMAFAESRVGQAKCSPTMKKLHRLWWGCAALDPPYVKWSTSTAPDNIPENIMPSRRQFLQMAGAGAAVSLASASGLAANPRKNAAATPIPRRTLHLGLASYTTRKLSLDKTLEIAKRLRLRYLCLKDFHLPLDSCAGENRRRRGEGESGRHRPLRLRRRLHAQRRRGRSGLRLRPGGRDAGHRRRARLRRARQGQRKNQTLQHRRGDSQSRAGRQALSHARSGLRKNQAFRSPLRTVHGHRPYGPQRPGSQPRGRAIRRPAAGSSISRTCRWPKPRGAPSWPAAA